MSGSAPSGLPATDRARSRSSPDDSWGTERAEEAAASIRAAIEVETPAVGLILGSGLGAVVDQIESRGTLPYGGVPGFPSTAVAGHAGTLVAGRLGGRPVVALAGRFHMYEGHPPALAAFPARVLAALGARALIVTNAAGGINRAFAPGTLMLIRDHLNLSFRNPLMGAAEAGDARFPDMSEPYDPGLLALARQVARERRVALAEGTYVSVLGPSYETPAEIRMVARLGGDAVGMSTVPEVLVARARGMRVLGVSCITNAAAGLSMAPIQHTDVLEGSRGASASLAILVTEVVRRA